MALGYGNCQAWHIMTQTAAPTSWSDGAGRLDAGKALANRLQYSATDLWLYDPTSTDTSGARTQVQFANWCGRWKGGPENNSFRRSWEVYRGDFNGDGLTDLWLYDRKGGSGPADSQVLFANGNGGWTSGPLNSSFRNDWEVYPGRFNGDNLTDLWLYDRTGIQSGKADSIVLFADGSGGWSSGPENNSFRTDWKVFPGRFNSDSLTDLWLYDCDGPTNSYPCDGSQGTADSQVLFANGSGGWSSGPENSSFRTDWEIYTGNFNSDSLTDLWLYDRTGVNGPSDSIVLFANGSGGWSSGPENNSFRTDWKVFRGRFNSDSLTDLWLYDCNGSENSYPCDGSQGTADSQVLFANGSGGWSSGPENNSFRTDWEVYPGAYDEDSLTDLFLYDRTGQNGAGGVPGVL